MRSQRPFRTPLALLLAFAVLATACGGGSSDETTADTQSPTVPADVADPDEPAESPTQVPADSAPTAEPDGDDDVSDEPTDDPDAGDDNGAQDDNGSDVATGTDSDAETPVAADPDATPVRIGLLNQENDPIASFPDIRIGVEAGVAHINAERGGIGGHPIELVVCTQAGTEQALACAQELAAADVVSVINGINVWTIAFDLYGTLGDTPVIGGVPLYGEDFTTDRARYFNGGSLAVFAAMTRFAAVDLGAENLVILEGFNPATAVAIEMAIEPLVEFYGMSLERIQIPPGSPDPSSAMAEVAAAGGDAVLVLATEAECANLVPFVPVLGVPVESMIYSSACTSADLHDLVGTDMIGSWVHRGGPTIRDPWLDQDVIDGLDVGEEILATYVPDASYSDFVALGLGTILEVERLFDIVGADNLGDDANIFAVADDGTLRGAEDGGFGWSCRWGDLGFPAVCSGDHRFVQVTDAQGNTSAPIGDDPVDGMAALAEAMAASG